MQGFGEGTPDGHGLAHRFHRRGQQRRGAREFLESESGNFYHDVVDCRLEARGGNHGDVVGQLVERVTDGQLGRDLCNRETGGLGGQRRGSRNAGVHLDDDHAAVDRIEAELHVGAPGIDTNFAKARDRGVAHDLVFFVGQRQGRGHGDAVAGVDTHRIDVLDRTDDDAVVRAVADDFHLVFFPAEHRFFDQHFRARGGFEPARDNLFKLFLVVGDAAAGAAQREARPNDGGEAGHGEGGAGFLERVGDCRARGFDADFGHRVAKFQAVLGAVDDVGLGADQLDSMPCQGTIVEKFHRGVERGLPAHGRQQGVGSLAGDDFFDDLGGDRLDVGCVGEARVSHNGGGVGVYQDDAVTLGFQGFAGLSARVVKLACLADDDRSGADDHDGVDVGALGHSMTLLFDGHSGQSWIIGECP